MRVCNKHRYLKSISIPSQKIMFDNSSKLFFCRNAKVKLIKSAFTIYQMGLKAGSTTWIHHFINQSSPRIQNFAKTLKQSQLHLKVPKMFSIEKLNSKELRYMWNFSMKYLFYFHIRFLVNLNTTVSFSSVRHPFQRWVHPWF